MLYRYYLQTHAELKPSLRRFTATTRERWTGTEWTSECASERACQTTGDQRISDAEARKFVSAQLNA